MKYKIYCIWIQYNTMNDDMNMNIEWRFINKVHKALIHALDNHVASCRYRYTVLRLSQVNSTDLIIPAHLAQQPCHSHRDHIFVNVRHHKLLITSFLHDFMHWIVDRYFNEWAGIPNKVAGECMFESNTNH